MGNQNRDARPEDRDDTTTADPEAGSRNRQDYRSDSEDDEHQRPMPNHGRQDAQTQRQTSQQRRDAESESGNEDRKARPGSRGGGG
jgi:hypothetical protein